jgi:type IV secretory pathway TrbD component
VGRSYPEAIMTATPDAIRPVYKAIHRPLTLAGVDRRLFFLALLLGAATFNLFYSFLAGLLTFAGLYGFGLWATRRDPEMLHILLASAGNRDRYDPAKHITPRAEVSPC